MYNLFSFSLSNFHFLLLFSFWTLGQSITTFPEHGGAYSLFPHEDLRTGKTLRSFDTSRSNDYNSQQISSRYHQPSSSSQFDNPLRTERLPYPPTSSSSQRDNYRSFTSSPPSSQNYRYNNRILFDDERLNFRGPYLPKVPRVIESYRRYPSIVPAFPEAKLPVRAKIPDEFANLPTRIHVFNPDSNSFIHSHDVEPRVVIDKSNNGPNEDVKPGRILIPGHHGKSRLNTNEPGPDLFLNHDEYLEYHTKIALQELQRNAKKNDDDEDDDSENANRVVLFSPSPINRGLVPPPQTSSDESGGSSATTSSSHSRENESDGFFRVKSHKEKRVHITSLLDNSPPQANPDQEISLETISSSSGKPILESGFVPSRHFYFETGEAKSPRTKAQGISSTTPKNTKVVGDAKSKEVITTTFSPVPVTKSYPYVKKSSPITRINVLTTSTPIAESITISPSRQYDDPQQQRTEIPLIFLESKEKVGDLSGKGKVIVVKRLKKKKDSLDSTSPSSVGTQLKTYSSSSIETTMTVHNQSLEESDELVEKTNTKGQGFILSPQSTSKYGVVSRVHAHITKCPQLHSQAEVLCDVHIRKRHGKSNPQLTVGWKRKFYNETQSDVVLALNTSVIGAYVEEDFHDKFNVTLAPGINPMLRSVLTIKSVEATDTGNYQCEVNDGENLLKSETLLFLCH